MHRIRFDQKHAPAYFNRGTIYEKNGEFEKALVEYNLAIKLDPHLQGAVEGVKSRRSRQAENCSSSGDDWIGLVRS
jgi:hypothetical protein